MSSSQVLKRAVQRSLWWLAGFCRRSLFLPGEHRAVRPPDRLLEMPGISTDEEVSDDDERARKNRVRGAKLIYPLSIRSIGR
jgi:hypothetical protein